ncbi:nucleoside-diphosphate-sugar epimerase [Sphingobium sp. B11D3B]|nr:nucleoside-diphosphate-sugar epimerase [Sphingobium sp. B11D3B]
MASAGFEVHGIARHGDPFANFSIVAADLADVDRIRSLVRTIKPKNIVHLAAISHVAHGNIDEMYMSNVVGTRNLLQAVVDTGFCPDRVLIASSANVYGNCSQEIIEEDCPFSPVNDYAISKMSTEFLARIFSDRIPVTVVRPFNYTGVGQSPAFLVPKIVEAARLGNRALRMGNLDVFRDFSDVRGVVAAYIRLLSAPQSAGETFNICSGRVISIRDILKMLTAMTGIEWSIDVDPALVRHNEVRVLRGSKRKFETLIGPLEMPPFEQTIEWMLESDAR